MFDSFVDLFKFLVKGLVHDFYFLCIVLLDELLLLSLNEVEVSGEVGVCVLVEGTVLGGYVHVEFVVVGFVWYFFMVLYFANIGFDDL